jgi:hypothetical protein
VGAPSGEVFPVQFLLGGASPAEQKMVQDAKDELTFYLAEKGEKDPWAYALYHCNTAANLYSSVHWCMSAGVMKDWNGDEIQIARSKGGVIATVHPYENVICPRDILWPPAEIVQKAYKSRQELAFEGLDGVAAKHGLGFYTDLQSIHSEDAITWSVFGTAARAPQSKLKVWLADLMRLLDLPVVQTDDPEVFLWRRVPHPDTLVPGGPEIDVGISTVNALILVEAKWQSGVGAAQGKMRDKDQIQLRGEFAKKYGPRLFPNRSEFAVVGVSLFADAFTDTTPEGIAFRSTTWERICSLASHPHGDELQRYFNWKKEHTRTANHASGFTARKLAKPQG